MGVDVRVSGAARRRRAGRIAAGWLACIGASAAVLAWVPAPWCWFADAASNLARESAVIAAVTLAALAAARRWRLTIVVAIALALQSPVWLASRAPRAAGPAMARILTINVRGGSDDTAGVLEAIRSARADVVHLCEVPLDLVRALRAGALDGELDGELGERIEIGWIEGVRGHEVLLSRWPMERVAGTEGDDLVAAVVRTPGGALGVVGVHAPSARGGARWRRGNAVVARAIEVARSMEGEGVATVIVGDFNATPTGARSRAMAIAGFARASPRLGSGTWPAGAPAWLGLGIDDAAVGAGLGVVSWRRARVPGSDHAGVVVELAPAVRGGRGR